MGVLEVCKSNEVTDVRRFGIRPSASLPRFAAAFVMAALLACVFALSGCSSDEGAGEGEGLSPVRIGTMPTEDFLPMWAAEKDGLFADAGVGVELLTFDSAQALSAAIASGDVDMAMTDIMRAAKLTESGTPVDLEWVTLGETADQGVFGILAPADAPYDDLREMEAWFANPAGDGQGEEARFDAADVRGVGVGANTVPEYVFDMLCEEAGVTLPSEEVASLPERYGLVASGQLPGAALPASLLRLGEAQGMKVVADDSTGENLSQSVMVARAGWAADNAEALSKVAQAWDAAVKAIGADPAAYAPLLAEKANLNEAIASDYPVSTYPAASRDGRLVHPKESMVQPVLAWMGDSGYGGKVSYDEATGALTR